MHKITTDISQALEDNLKVKEKWGSLTELARNEWICWVTIVKKAETREAHIKRMCEDLLAGKRRPCCWPSCPHRNELSKKYFNI